MKRSIQRSIHICIALVTAAAAVTAVQPSKSAASKKSSAKKKYVSSSGKSSASKKKTVAKKVTKKILPARPAVSAKARAAAHEDVYQSVASRADLPVENAAALIPFFEQLYRHQRGEVAGPLRILHYGDSHTAADEWTGDLRTHFQEKFGDGGSGFSLAGRPWNSYRRLDVRSGSTRGWHSDGLVGRAGDGVYGLGGVSMSTAKAHEAIYLDANAAEFELFYYQQPGGGTLQIYDNGVPMEQISTDGEPGPAYYHLESVPGQHRVEAETLDRGPVRLFGWVAENTTGVTYETLGINGAEASIILNWNEETLRSNIERRNPALIVLAYGTNEAGRKDWTLESYRNMYSQLIQRLRMDAPTATILVVGPADRTQRVRKVGWQTMEKIDVIAEAQRQAALANGCAFWDTQAKMGGKGSMLTWVAAGMAQADHVHFTGPGYRMLGDAVFRDVMSQYDIFLQARAAIVANASPSPASSPGRP
ncbi:MAG TPA: SGNH/GDSL hydrolase family protein [Bryobacteraceae bacterium]|nr:SGNH/GDSL hydrolase family protein [Bryobacteraceae bacterium]